MNYWSHPGLFGMYVYVRTSPRGNTKFGITICPWERCRQFQQGTDELVNFDHLYLLTTTDGPWVFESIEQDLKTLYSSQCLHNQTKRAGHTEWYQGLDHAAWLQSMQYRVAHYNNRRPQVELRKLTEHYHATRGSQCPFRMPTGSDAAQLWIRNNYSKFPVL